MPDEIEDDEAIAADFEDDGDELDPEIAELALPDDADIILDNVDTEEVQSS